MKIKFLIVIFFITITGFSQKPFSTYPTYKDIVTHFFEQYDVASIEHTSDILFEKRVIGWNVTTLDNISKDTIRNLLWDSKKEEYKTLKFKHNNNKVDTDAVENFIKTSFFIRFNSLPYYGYVGWDKDLMQLYENKTNLTDYELYSLGYAYSSYANAFLNDNFEFSDKKARFHLAVSSNSMNNEQLKTYLTIENKAIKTYLELYKRNPKFETIVGQIGVKYYNEIASNFLNLRIYQNENIAQEQLKQEKLYSDNYNLYAQNMLDSCEQNAILFTAGDNDTYPLLVYQIQKNYRKDVLIINTSLIQNIHYIEMMKNSLLDSDGINVSINDDFIRDEKSEVLIFSNTTNDTISIENLNDIALDTTNYIKYYTKSYKTIFTKNFTFKDGNSVLNWSINEPTLYRNHLIILDIIATNNWKRPIYFAANNSEDNYLGLSKYLQFEGLVYKLVSREGKLSNNEIGFLNPIVLEQKLSYLNHSKNKTNLTIEERQLIRDNRLIYNRLAESYIEDNEFKKAESILDECVNLYPNELSYFGSEVIIFIENYNKLGNFEKAKKIEEKILQNIENGLDNYCFLTQEERKAKYENIKLYLETIKN